MRDQLRWATEKPQFLNGFQCADCKQSLILIMSLMMCCWWFAIAEKPFPWIYVYAVSSQVFIKSFSCRASRLRFPRNHLSCIPPLTVTLLLGQKPPSRQTSRTASQACSLLRRLACLTLRCPFSPLASLSSFTSWRSHRRKASRIDILWGVSPCSAAGPAVGAFSFLSVCLFGCAESAVARRVSS